MQIEHSRHAGFVGFCEAVIKDVDENVDAQASLNLVYYFWHLIQSSCAILVFLRKPARSTPK